MSDLADIPGKSVTELPSRAEADRPLQIATATIATIAALTGIHFASSVLAPVACALFIIALAWPMQKWLQARLPRLLALAIVISIIAAVFVVFGSLIAWGLGRIARWLATDADRFQTLYTQIAIWLEERGIAVAGLWAEHFNTRWLVSAAQGITGRLNTTIGFWLVVIVYVILGLLEVDSAERKLRSLRNRRAADVALDGAAETAAKLRRYAIIRTLMSVATGALVWVIASFAGLPLAAEWGVIAFALNYIPFIGPFIATVFPTLFALAQFGSWQEAFVVFVCLNCAQFVIGSYIEPNVSGRALAISPFLVLFSVFLWTFLWGVFGAFIGVPITIAILTFCAQHPSSRWIADLLGSPDVRSTVD
jgi:predicted PurR-regulated permease PerM